MSIKRVGFIGLGAMGKALATNLIEAGFDLMVYDIRPEPMNELKALGAKIARSPSEVGAHGEVVALAVVNDAQVESVVLGDNGALQCAAPGAIIVIHSTIHPKTVRKVA